MQAPCQDFFCFPTKDRIIINNYFPDIEIGINYMEYHLLLVRYAFIITVFLALCICLIFHDVFKYYHIKNYEE